MGSKSTQHSMKSSQHIQFESARQKSKKENALDIISISILFGDVEQKSEV